MSEKFYEGNLSLDQGYSEYELEAMKIPTETNRKCLKQNVDFNMCYHKVSALSYIFGKYLSTYPAPVKTKKHDSTVATKRGTKKEIQC